MGPKKASRKNGENPADGELGVEAAVTGNGGDERQAGRPEPRGGKRGREQLAELAGSLEDEEMGEEEGEDEDEDGEPESELNDPSLELAKKMEQHLMKAMESKFKKMHKSLDRKIRQATAAKPTAASPDLAADPAAADTDDVQPDPLICSVATATPQKPHEGHRQFYLFLKLVNKSIETALDKGDNRKLRYYLMVQKAALNISVTAAEQIGGKANVGLNAMLAYIRSTLYGCLAEPESTVFNASAANMALEAASRGEGSRQGGGGSAGRRARQAQDRQPQQPQQQGRGREDQRYNGGRGRRDGSPAGRR